MKFWKYYLTIFFITFGFVHKINAREYIQGKIICSIFASETDMFNVEKELPYKLDLDFLLSLDKKKKKL